MRPYAFAAAAFLVGVASSLALLLALRSSERRTIAIDFNRAAIERTLSLEGDRGLHNLIVFSLQSLFLADEEVDRKQFHNFAAPLLLHEPSIQALEWIPRVGKDERAACEAAARGEVGPDFRFTERTESGLRTRSESEEYFPVYYVEPRQGNEQALGFDLASDVERREALVRARDTRQPVATAPIRLVQEKEAQAGYLVYLAVYKGDPAPGDAEERRSRLKGFVLGVFRVIDTLNDALRNLKPIGVDIHLFDSTEPADPRFLCFHPSRTRAAPLPFEEYLRREPPGGLRHTASLDMAGRRWTVVCTPTPEFVASRTTWVPWAALAGGLLLTALLASYLLNTARHVAYVGRLMEEAVATSRDLATENAERRQAEDALRKSEERFSQVAQTAGEWIWEVDADGVYTYSSPAVDSMLGYKPEEVVGRKRFHDFFAPGVKAEQLESAAQALARKKSFRSWPNVNVHRDGALVCLETTGVPVLDAAGGVVGYRGVDVDVTQRKRTQEELRRSKELLEERVEERTAELAQTNVRLQKAQTDMVQSEKMGLLGQLAAGIAHEINTPAGAILNVVTDSYGHMQEMNRLEATVASLPPATRDWLRGMLGAVFRGPAARSEAAVRAARRQLEDRLRRAGLPDSRRIADVAIACGLAETLDEDALLHLKTKPVLESLEHALAIKAAVDISQSSILKITRIVRALRFYSREESGTAGRLDVNESIENTLVILQHRLKHVAEVGLDLADALPAVRGGPELAQVWTNLLNNACDAIEMRHASGMGRIDVASRRAEGCVVVTIANAGPAIPDDILGKMYDPFFTTKPAGKGTGLGLSICASILGRCGGSIAARNEEGRVVFEVTVPADETAAGREPSGRDAATAGAASTPGEKP